MQLALGDALAVALLESRGFTALKFRELHPGGRLGAKLKFIRDIMHTGEAVPLVRLGTPMSDAVVVMTAKGLGCVGVTAADGTLAGIITDGDLRRHMRPGLLAAKVDDVMTPKPKTISSDQLASEAIELLNSSKITAVIVVDAGTPAGIVHLHDLLRAGVA
jgi:arabinose-5-phosphate isomerase